MSCLLLMLCSSISIGLTRKLVHTLSSKCRNETVCPSPTMPHQGRGFPQVLAPGT